jgi:CRP-like cAMP-binding protein
MEPGGTEIAQVHPGGYFGEMSLLTGDLRTATVTSVTDCVLIEITADRFRDIVAANPVAVERIGAVVARRRMELEGKRQAAAVATGAMDSPGGLVDRIRRFLRIAPRTSGTAVR